jgi:1-acyl-sn-glycerol-3-phosphate acyltransferase
VVANHLSFFDPPLLAASISRPLDFIGKRELFSNPLTSAFLRSFRVHPLDRAGSGADALRLSMRLLAQDCGVAIFPEGRRSPDGRLGHGLAGAAYLAIKSQAPILPVGITGTANIPAWRTPFPLCRFKANIGQPFTLPVLENTPNREVVNSIRDMIMSRIADLLPEMYRGVYPSPVSSLPSNENGPSTNPMNQGH